MLFSNHQVKIEPVRLMDNWASAQFYIHTLCYKLSVTVCQLPVSSSDRLTKSSKCESSNMYHIYNHMHFCINHTATDIHYVTKIRKTRNHYFDSYTYLCIHTYNLCPRSFMFAHPREILVLSFLKIMSQTWF